MASILRTKISDPTQSLSYGVGGDTDYFSSWWSEINEYQKLQQGVFYVLCASYALVSLVALVQLIRIQLRVPEYGWMTQKLFHSMNFIVNGLRALLFGICKSVFHLRPKVQLIRIQLRVPEHGWTTQKLFHSMNFILNGLRALLFGFYKSVFHLRPKELFKKLKSVDICFQILPIFIMILILSGGVAGKMFSCRKLIKGENLCEDHKCKDECTKAFNGTSQCVPNKSGDHASCFCWYWSPKKCDIT